MTSAERTSYEVDEQGVARAAPASGPRPRNAIDTQMLVELLEHLAVARDDEAVRVLVDQLLRPHGPLGRRRRQGGARRGGQGRAACSSSPTSTTRSSPSRSRRSPPATATSSAAAPRSRSPATCGSAAPTCGCASRARRSASRSARPAWSPSAASPPPSTCCSPRARSAPTRRCASASSTGSPRRPATEEAALELAAEVAAHPPEAVARLKRMLHEWDDVEGRSRGRGRGPGRVAALRPGPADLRLGVRPAPCVGSPFLGKVVRCLARRPPASAGRLHGDCRRPPALWRLLGCFCADRLCGGTVNSVDGRRRRSSARCAAKQRTRADCTLRAAIELSNASAGEHDLIGFDGTISTVSHRHDHPRLRPPGDHLPADSQRRRPAA